MATDWRASIQKIYVVESGPAYDGRGQLNLSVCKFAEVERRPKLSVRETGSRLW